MSNFIQADPNQPLLLPVGLREWVPSDGMVHFVPAAVEQVPLEKFKFTPVAVAPSSITRR